MIKVMKKMFFYLPLAALALAACSNEEVVNNAQQIAAVNGDQLQIAPVVTGTTRATAVTTSNLASFKVRITGNFQDGSGEETAATPITSGSEVVVTKSGGSWSTASPYWWADKTTEATFTAWSPADQTTAVTVENAIADQKDIVVAFNNGKREDFDAGVPLNFQHVMSQIIVKALNKDAAADFTVKVGGIKIMNAKNKGTLTLPTASTAAPFDWTSYDPWGATATGSDNYINGVVKAKSADVTSPITLTASANNLADPMMLMPQTLATSDLTQATLSGNYLAILVQVTGGQVGYRDADGHYYHTSVAAENKIPFTAKRNDTDNDYNTYTKDELTALSAGNLPAGWTSEYDHTDANVKTAIQALVGKTIVKDTEIIYPRDGFSTKTDQYAYVGVDLGGLTWEPGKKYVYTLNFSKEGIGKAIADQPEDATGESFPSGRDMESGEAGKPGEDIIDNPTQLFFTVTVDEWIDADAINKDM